MAAEAIPALNRARAASTRLAWSEARESYDRAIRWMEKNAPDNKELIRFRAEAAELLDVAQPQAPPDPQLKEN